MPPKKPKDAEREPADVPDGMELRRDGTVLLHFETGRVRLRRPKIGELEEMREAVADRDDALLALNDELEANADTPGDDTAKTLEKRKRRRELQRQHSDLNRKWLVDAFARLTKDAVPEVSDWPSGLDSDGAIVALLTHWRSVPLRSGAS